MSEWVHLADRSPTRKDQSILVNMATVMRVRAGANGASNLTFIDGETITVNECIEDLEEILIQHDKFLIWKDL